MKMEPIELLLVLKIFQKNYTNKFYGIYLLVLSEILSKTNFVVNSCFKPRVFRVSMYLGCEYLLSLLKIIKIVKIIIKNGAQLG